MKLKLSAVVISTVFMACAAQAATKDQGKGEVKFTGSIIEAPCSINPESAKQEISLGQIPVSQLKDGGKSTPVDFQIKLEKCDTQTLTKVKATFTGAPSNGNPDLLGITGDASGASIAITNGSGTVVKLGQASTAVPMIDGSNTLAFAAYLQGDKAAAGGGTAPIIVPGNFSSIANYALAYQ